MSYKQIFVKDLYDDPEMMAEELPIYVLANGVYHEIEFYRDLNMGNGYQAIKPGYTLIECTDGYECELTEFDHLWVKEG